MDFFPDTGGRADDQLQALGREAADEVELVALPPVAEGQGGAPGARLGVAGARWHPEPHIPLAGALAQLQHLPIGAAHPAEMGAGASGAGGNDEQWRRQLDQLRSWWPLAWRLLPIAEGRVPKRWPE